MALTGSAGQLEQCRLYRPGPQSLTPWPSVGLWKREGAAKKDLYVTGSMTIGKTKGDLVIHGDLKAPALPLFTCTQTGALATGPLRILPFSHNARVCR